MPLVEIRISGPLREEAGGLGSVQVEGADVAEALAALVDRHPDLRRRLYLPNGELRNFVTLFRNDEDIRSLERGATILRPGDVVSIVPSIGGG
jgi:sulfur-carrier protein